MPFVNQMVIGFGITVSSAARYAGLIESALVFTEGESSLSQPTSSRLTSRFPSPPTPTTSCGASHLSHLLPALGLSCRSIRSETPARARSLLLHPRLYRHRSLPLSLHGYTVSLYLYVCGARHCSRAAGVLGAVAVLVRTVQFEIADAASVDRGEWSGLLER